MAKQAILTQKPARITNGKLLTPQPLQDRGMNLEECRAICTSPEIPVREKLFFRVIYETQLRPFEALNLLIENWDREQQLVTAVIYFETSLRMSERSVHVVGISSS